MGCKLLVGIIFSIFLAGSVCAISDVAIFQGQYYSEEEFQQGTFTFEFDVYDDEVAGNLIDSKVFNITTGTWGQWRIEYEDLSEVCNDTTKDYFVEITIDNSTQTLRRRLTHFTYMRKDVNEITTGDLTISNILNFVLGGYIQEFVDRFFISKNLELGVDLTVIGTSYFGDLISTGVATFDEVNVNELNVSELSVSELNVSELTVSVEANINELKVAGQEVCLEDGTNCPAGGGGTSYVSFISTVDGDLALSDRYLPLGTDSLITLTSEESSWIIDRDMTITGILWDSVSNTRSATSAITLMSGDDKNSLLDTGLSKDIQGVVSGSDLTFSVSLSQGDAVVIKYDSGGVGGTIHDLSITLIGTYD